MKMMKNKAVKKRKMSWKEKTVQVEESRSQEPKNSDQYF